MTREEAIKSLQNIVEYWTYKPTEVEAAKMAIAALRPVSRERVEKMKSPWKRYFNGDYNDEIYYCEECGHKLESYSKLPNFCPDCGVPKTDEAVEMVMERLEELKDGKSD